MVIFRAPIIQTILTTCKVIKDPGSSRVRSAKCKSSRARIAQADATYRKHPRVRDESEVQALIEGVIARFGRIDVAINNAWIEGI
jgi:NAD(P)-dependent dehydrogenase (short-subunit alcohol dehydrogenase family)